MTILLDGTSGTRTGRWLKAVAPQSIARQISTISVIGLPLAFVVAREYERGKAAYYGIPEEFIRVGPIDALAPFVAIAGTLWLFFIAAHEVERVGITKIATSMGARLRVVIATLFLIGLGIGVRDELRQRDGLGATLVTLLVFALVAGVIYAVLWWLPPSIAWIGRRVSREVAKVRATLARQGRFERHFFRGALDYRLSTNIKRFFWVVFIAILLIGKGSVMLGWWHAQSQARYAVLAGPEKQVILAVYDEKTFTASLDGRHIDTVRILQTADVKDVPVVVGTLGSLQSNDGFLAVALSTGW